MLQQVTANMLEVLVEAFALLVLDLVFVAQKIQKVEIDSASDLAQDFDQLEAVSLFHDLELAFLGEEGVEIVVKLVCGDSFVADFNLEALVMRQQRVQRDNVCQLFFLADLLAKLKNSGQKGLEPLLLLDPDLLVELKILNLVLESMCVLKVSSVLKSFLNLKLYTSYLIFVFWTDL